MFLSEAVSSAPQFFYLAPWVVFFPVIGLLINIFFGSRILKSGPMGEKIVGGIGSAAAGLSFIVALLLGISLNTHPEGQIVPLAEWISIGELNIRWAFQVDTLSVTMMLVVAGVGTLIHIYSIGYMHEDVRHKQDPSQYQRFFVFMNLFIAMMMILVSSDNYLMLFVGWEGVGLCSYLLIGFWYGKGKDGIGNAIAAKKAFIVNRIGDFGFLIAALIIFWVFGTFEFESVFRQAPIVASVFPAALVAITVFMLIGVTGKSAQIPLFVWLPDAMAGPTPVSALIHAATMVTAGVYLIARSSEIFYQVPQSQNLVALVGAVTALFAATIAVGQFDIKKVLAYSTISQLGFMVSAVGMGAVVAGMFHLVAHAFFKALLFLSAGSVIQGLERGYHYVEHDPTLKKQAEQMGPNFDPQDMRNMGGVKNRMKITYLVYLIGSMALAGIPVFVGFWSKDEILAEAKDLNAWVFGLLILAAFLTAFYITRQVLMVFFGKPHSPAAEYAEESPAVMTIPLIILAVLSALGGILNLPHIHTFTHWLENTFENIHEGRFVMAVAVLSTGLVLVSSFLAWLIYRPKNYEKFMSIPVAKRPDDPMRTLLGPLFEALNRKWWVDELYNLVIVQPYKQISHFLATNVDWDFWHDWVHDKVIVAGFDRFTSFLTLRIDLGIIDAAANGLGDITEKASSSLRRVQTGYVRNYALSIFLGMVLILGYLILR